MKRLAVIVALLSALLICSLAAAGAPPQAQANLVFIHHSCGANWLQGGLTQALNARGIHVADITHGWKEYGDHTDTGDWPTWFNDEAMPQVYAELNQMDAQNQLDAAPGENQVILFKSCFPNSDVDGSIDDEKQVYLNLLPYMQAHPDK